METTIIEHNAENHTARELVPIGVNTGFFRGATNTMIIARNDENFTIVAVLTDPNQLQWILPMNGEYILFCHGLNATQCMRNLTQDIKETPKWYKKGHIMVQNGVCQVINLENESKIDLKPTAFASLQKAMDQILHS